MAYDLAPIQACIRNTLDPKASQAHWLAGIIGDAPSHYSKSPPLWNEVFRALNMDALYLPFDVDEARLADFVQTLKACDRIMGANVTVPHKVEIIDHLDEIDEQARQIKAVNAIVRTPEGRLLGTNTDGKGFIDSLTLPQPGEKSPFVESLRGVDVLIIGAGGSARAVAFQLAEVVQRGRLLICNRTPEAAQELANEIDRLFGGAAAVEETEMEQWAPRVGLIVNCTTKGQGGVRRLSGGRITLLEPYSALAPAKPAVFPEAEYGNPGFYRAWLSASLSDIEANNQASLNLALTIPPHVNFCDLIYFPAETVFLRHGRLSGHKTLNGKAMIIGQAVEAFHNRICRRYLQSLGMYQKETHRRISELMHEAWTG